MEMRNSRASAARKSAGGDCDAARRTVCGGSDAAARAASEPGEQQAAPGDANGTKNAPPESRGPTRVGGQRQRIIEPLARLMQQRTGRTHGERLSAVRQRQSDA